MHSHHSHSGQFVQHAKNTLEEIVLRAIELRFKQYCLTEHMFRLEAAHLYPEEVASQTTVEALHVTFDAYFKEARRLQRKYADKLEILVGFEGEGISHDYLKQMEIIIATYKPDMFVGSLHHSDGVPIDYDAALWEKALATSDNSVMQVYRNYFIQLHGIIARLRPPVIAHFDLIRLFSPPFDLKTSPVWPHVERTISQAVRAHCMFEINSAALRKGWTEPYPQRDIAELIVAKGGRFCLSDDAHSVEQVGLNYDKLPAYLDSLGVSHVYALHISDNRKLVQVPVPVSELREWIDVNKRSQN